MADIRYRVQAELENIDKIIRDMPVTTTLSSLSTLELAGVGALLNSFYNGLENIIKQIILSRKLPLPTGETWHKDLVEIACTESIISESTKDGFKEYLAFRHFFSHGYTFDLDPARIDPLVSKIESIYKAFKNDLELALGN